MQEELKVIITAENSDYKKKMEEAESKASNFGKTVGKMATDMAKFSIKATTAVASASATMVGLITKGSLEAYADYEQLVGGVDTLFKKSSGKLQQYAEEAYKNQQLSANQYMEIATAFSASLLQSLGRDTDKAVDIANMAITDMADNANKMGSSMESIQNAYQGFAKQNYTMLDNLKLGYGGTKQEMERLLADAEKLTGIKYDINNLNDIFLAIHAIQQELEITGTSREEAMKTIQGSANMAKSAWLNLLVAIARTDSDLTKAVGNFTESVEAVISNVGTRVEQVLPRISFAINLTFIKLQKTIVKTFKQIAPAVIQAITNIARLIIPILQGLISTILSFVPEIIDGFISIMGMLDTALNEIVNALIADLPQIVSSIASGIVSGAGIIFNSALTLFNGICEAVPIIIQQLGQMLPSLIKSIGTQLEQGIGTIISSATTLLNGIAEAIPIVVEGLDGVIPDLVIGIVDALLANIGTLVEGFINLFKALITAIPQILNAILPAIPELVNGIVEGLISCIDVLIDGFVELFKAFVKALPDIIQALKDNSSEIVDGIVQGLIDCAGALVEGFIELFKAIWDALPEIIADLQEAGSIAIDSFAEGLLLGTLELFGVGQEKAQEFVDGFTDGLGETFMKTFLPAFNLEIEAWDANGNPVEVYKNAGANSGSAYADGILSAEGEVIVSANTLTNSAMSAVYGATEGYRASCDSVSGQAPTSFAEANAEAQAEVNDMINGVNNTMNDASTAITNSTNEQKEALVDGYTDMADEAEAPLEELHSTLEEKFSSIETTVDETVNNVVKAVEDMVSKLLDTVNFDWDLPYLKIPHLSVSGRFNTNPPSVPTYSISWYAKGGVFDMPTLFNYGNGSIGGLGENGAEAVVPLENNTEWLDRIAERLGAGKSTPVVLQVDGKTLAETTINSVNTLTRQTGKLGLVLA